MNNKMGKIMKIKKAILLIMLSMGLSAMEKEQPRSHPNIEELASLILENDIQGVKSYLSEIDNPKSFLSQTFHLGEELFTPIMLVIAKKRPMMLKALIDAGADVNFSLPDSLRTPLHFAVLINNPIIVNLLLAAGADPNKKNRTGQTALMHAVRLPDPTIFDKLLEMGANLDVQNNEGFSALMLAANHGDLQTVKKLLEAGANPILKTKRGGTALDIARTKGFADIQNLLEHYMVLHMELQNE